MMLIGAASGGCCPRLAAGKPVVPAQRAVGGSRGERSSARRLSLGERDDDHRDPVGTLGGDHRPEVGVHDERLRGAVAQHVRDLLATPVPVDRHGARAQRHGRDRSLEELDRVAQQQRDPVACADAELGEPAGRAQRAVEQLGIGGEALAAADADLLAPSHRRGCYWG